MKARRDSRCPGCGDRIREGEEITATDDGWVHLDCGGTPTITTRKPVSVCPTCHLTTPCECEDLL